MSELDRDAIKEEVRKELEAEALAANDELIAEINFKLSGLNSVIGKLPNTDAKHQATIKMIELAAWLSQATAFLQRATNSPNLGDKDGKASASEQQQAANSETKEMKNGK